MNRTTVHAFRLFAPGDPCDLEFGNWSRIHEYPAVLNELGAIHKRGRLRVHNTAAGGEFVCHRQFMEALRAYDTLHTDLVVRDGVCFYDIREPAPEWDRAFDAVVCISTLEHLLPDEQRRALENLARQVRAGGRLVITFDLPGADLGLLERIAGCRITRQAVPLNGSNSRLPNPRFTDLNVGLLSLSPA